MKKPAMKPGKKEMPKKDSGKSAKPGKKMAPPFTKGAKGKKMSEDMPV